MTARIGGQGFTVFNWQSHLIAYADTIKVTPAQPVSPPVVIQPLNAQRPLEIITAGASGAGTIDLTITELYNFAIWQKMTDLTKSQDIIDICRTLASLGRGVTVTKAITPGNGAPAYAETFFNVIVASVEANGETINIEAMEIQKDMQLMYTHSLKSYINGGNYAFARNVATS